MPISSKLLFRCSLNQTIKRCYNFEPTKKYQLVIPLSPRPWSTADFEENRHEFGVYMNIFGYHANKMNSIFDKEGTLKGVPNRERFLNKEEVRILLSQTRIHKMVDKGKGFYLTDEPFVIPHGSPTGIRANLRNSWNTFKLKGLDESFDQSDLFKDMPYVFEDVSQKIFKQDFASLEHLMIDNTLENVVKGFESLNEKNKQLFDLTANDLYSVDRWGHIPVEAYTGLPVDFVSMDFRKHNGQTFVDFMVLFVAVYKKSLLNEWPKIPKSYGFDMAKVIYGNYLFTKRVKPKVDPGWMIRKLNYIIVP